MLPKNIINRVIWIDESIEEQGENLEYKEKLAKRFKFFEGFSILELGFKKLYSNDFDLIVTIVSGKLWGRYLSLLKKEINKIYNIPYTIIFTSENYKEILLQKKHDKDHCLSYDTLNAIYDPFFNPGGIVSCFEDLMVKIESLEINQKYNINPKGINKFNYEGSLTFEYINNNEDLIAPALYKDIIINEPIKKEEVVNVINYLLSFNNKDLNDLLLNLKNFRDIPLEILSKYLVRCYTFESSFYRSMNLDLMKSNMEGVYKSYIKILYLGIDKKSFPTSKCPVLFRGAQISKEEIRKIFKYKDTKKLQKIIVFSKAFLSFSKDEQEARKFINLNDEHTRGVLFVLANLNCNNESKADIQKLSAIPEEKEILFFPGSSFLITDIVPMNDGVIIIKLIYFGKFKEMYKMFDNNETQVNRIIETNCLTKTIAGKKLEFLGNGQYLIIENDLKIHEENSF